MDNEKEKESYGKVLKKLFSAQSALDVDKGVRKMQAENERTVSFRDKDDRRSGGRKGGRGGKGGKGGRGGFKGKGNK